LLLTLKISNTSKQAYNICSMPLDYLMGATIAVLLVALLRVQETRLKLYILSELVATMGIEAAALTWPDYNSREYAAAYCVCRAIDLSAAVWLSRPRAGTAISALLLTAIAIIGLGGRLDLNSGIALAQGLGFAIAGMSIILQPVSLPNTVLAVLWLMLAAFFYGYGMGWRLQVWQNLADYWNTVACIVGFGLIAVCGVKDGSSAIRESNRA
jgi:hypothetical protein